MKSEEYSMKKKGFTLIELLAVIVILAVISLIATPLVLNVIETARKGASKSSALGYVDAIEKQIAINQISNENVVLTDGLYKDFEELEQKYGVEVKGNIPSKGWVQIKNGQVIDYSLLIDGYTITSGSDPVKNGNIKEDPILSHSDEYLKLKEALEKEMSYSYTKYIDFKRNISNITNSKEQQELYDMLQANVDKIRLVFGEDIVLTDGTTWTYIGGPDNSWCSNVNARCSIPYPISETKNESNRKNYLYLMPKEPVVINYVTQVASGYNVGLTISDSKKVDFNSLKEELTNKGIIFDENSVIRLINKSEYSLFSSNYKAKDAEEWVLSELIGKVYIIDSNNNSTLYSLPILGSYSSKYLMKIPMSNLQL